MNDTPTFHPFDLAEWQERIEELNFRQMADIRGLLTSRMSEMRETGITQLRATIAEQAQLLGVELKDLVPKKQRRKRRSREELEAAGE
jgi:hypothetical protein